MKVKINCYEYDFANQVACLAIDTGHPIIKNVNANIVIYLHSEAERELFEKQLYEKANRYKKHIIQYNSKNILQFWIEDIKIKTVVERRMKGEE